MAQTTLRVVCRTSALHLRHVDALPPAISFRLFHHSRNSGKQEELFPQRLTLPENRGFVPVLSPNQVTSILSEHQASVVQKPVGSGPVRYFDSNFLASNHPTEDRRAIGWLPQSGGSLYAVYDGHGGSACAQAVSERLFEYIAVSLLPPALLEEYSHSMRTEQPLPLLVQHRFRNDYISDDLLHTYRQSLQRYVVETLSFSGDDLSLTGSTADMLAAAFRRLDDDISHEAMPVSGAVDLDLVEVALSGCCACVAYVNGMTVDVANVGDCRAVIGRQQADGQWMAVPLSIDQNIDNEAEFKRLCDAHPNEAGTIRKNDRLLGLLIPLRAFGDIRFKWTATDLKNLSNIVGGSIADHFVPSNYFTPPYVTANPDVVHHRLTPSDRFMIIASDGLWETMSNEQAVEIIGDHMLGKESQSHAVNANYSSLTFGEIANILHERQRGRAHQSTDDNGATHLIRHALGCEHRKVSEMLTFPPAIARHFRDDMTVIVVYFDTNFLKENSSD